MYTVYCRLYWLYWHFLFYIDFDSCSKLLLFCSNSFNWFNWFLLSQVCGIVSSRQGEESMDNNKSVLASFSEVGYEMKWKKVCPTKIGIPMSRNRIHYQGVLRSAVKNASLQMANVDRIWSSLLQSTYPTRNLEDFLISDETAKVINPNAGSARKTSEMEKWKTMHQEMLDAFQAVSVCVFHKFEKYDSQSKNCQFPISVDCFWLNWPHETMCVLLVLRWRLAGKIWRSKHWSILTTWNLTLWHKESKRWWLSWIW